MGRDQLLGRTVSVQFATVHRFALARNHIGADMVEGTEFPRLAVKQNVQGSPHTIINEERSVIGALSEIGFARESVKATGKDLSSSSLYLRVPLWEVSCQPGPSVTDPPSRPSPCP
jgi:hypothetical protein